jgi:hypothetical protein
MTADLTLPTAGIPLRVVVDAQIALSIFLVRRDRPAVSSVKRALLPLLPRQDFHWLWTPDILADYARGATAIEQEPRIMHQAAFDRIGFQLLLGALQLRPPAPVSVMSLRAARRQIAQATRVRHRDLDDAIYLACAVDGEAHLLTSQDATLLALGSPYEGVRIVTWQEFLRILQTHGLPP